MFSGRASCCRAAKRKLQAPSEEIWITDSTLVWAFQRFYLVSRPSRRNGTSVPGPMESRRRLGRRRMTHFSEAVRPPMQDVASLWSTDGSKGCNNWRWEAPSSPPAGDTMGQLPSWLTDLDQSTADELIPRRLEDRDNFSIDLQSNARNDLKWFCDRIRSETRLNIVLGICKSFCQNSKQSSPLGQVSAAVLVASVREVPRDIRNNISSKDIGHSTCISFYRAIWEGITACKVLQPAEVESKVLQLLFTNLPKLPIQISGALITDLLNSITENQKRELKQEIHAIGSSLFIPVACGSHSELSEIPKTSYPEIRPPQDEILSDIKVVEDLVGALIKSFGVCSPEEVTMNTHYLIRLSTAHVSRAIFSKNVGPLRELKEARKMWLKFIVRLSPRSEDLLVEACMIIEAGDHGGSSRNLPRLSVHALCDVLFEHWASRISRTSILSAHAAFRASLVNQGNFHMSDVHLCRALKQQSIPWHEEVQCLLRVLRRLRGATASLYCCLKRLENAKIYLDASILATEITALSSTNIRYAMDLFECCSKGRPKPYALPLECFPDLAIAMINDPSCNPGEIWQALGGVQMWKEECISKSRIHLVMQIALGFSQARSISTRVAFRNVVRCYRYLSYHNVPISSDFARILTYIGVERHILENGSISDGRLHWVLDIISRAEGVGVAQRIKRAVVSAQAREKERRARENHPLKLGPID